MNETNSDIYTLCSNADWIEETSNAFIVGGCQIYYKSNHGVMHKLGTKLGMDIPLPFLNIPPPPITNEDGSVIQFFYLLSKTCLSMAIS